MSLHYNYKDFTTHVIVSLLDGEVRSGLAGFFHGLEHGLAFLFGLLEPLPLLFDVTLFLFFNFTNPPFFFLLLLLSEAFLFFGAGYLYIKMSCNKYMQDLR